MDEWIELIYNQPLLVSLLILSGFAVCLAGYKIFRLYSAAIGFVIGIIVGYYVSIYFGFFPLISFLISGMIFAVVFWLIYRLGLFLTGAVVGYMFLSYLIPERLLFVYVFAVLCGILVLFIERFLFIVITAFLGATAFVVAIYILITGTLVEEFLLEPRSIVSVAFSSPLMFLLWFTLGVLGTISQLVLTREEEK
ncbi:MAG: TMEM198/TM7SF3 family protein [Archaeoglobaceae archaeon]|nr:TMEM198/TM7SF3 family protein [Archaeoglobaceae archaeon]MDW8128577.1 DUF4203 domain-containing protein [Archaeoglobaceae archaeon]